MSKASYYLRKGVSYHIIIWALLLIPHGYFTFNFVEKIGVEVYLLNLLVYDGLLLAIVYLNILYLIRKFFETKRYVLYFLILGVLAALYLWAVLAMESFLSRQMKYQEPIVLTMIWHFFNICRYSVIAFLLFNLREKHIQEKQMDEIRLQKLNTEINYLRAQINPHFLFNTLNNLYGLALQKSERTPEIIIKLSKMMDFMLYELNGSKVPVKRDVENLENFIDIERIRQGNNAEIILKKNGIVKDQKIEPLLMLPLVENAFKHGINQMIEGAYLEMELTVTPDQLRFTARNSYRLVVSGQKQIHPSLGITNLRRRLDLFYPNNYTLQIQDDSANYEVTLIVNL